MTPAWREQALFIQEGKKKEEAGDYYDEQVQQTPYDFKHNPA